MKAPEAPEERPPKPQSFAKLGQSDETPCGPADLGGTPSDTPLQAFAQRTLGSIVYVIVLG